VPPPERPPGSRRLLARARRLVVRSVVGAFVGVVLLLVFGFASPALGVPSSELGAQALLAFPAAGILLMNAFGRSRPARWMLRTTRRIADATLGTAT
jgi:hypothetical protein